MDRPRGQWVRGIWRECSLSVPVRLSRERMGVVRKVECFNGVVRCFSALSPTLSGTGRPFIILCPWIRVKGLWRPWPAKPRGRRRRVEAMRGIHEESPGSIDCRKSRESSCISVSKRQCEVLQKGQYTQAAIVSSPGPKDVGEGRRGRPEGAGRAFLG